MPNRVYKFKQISIVAANIWQHLQVVVAASCPGRAFLRFCVLHGGYQKKQGCAALGTPLWIYIGLFYYYCNNN